MIRHRHDRGAALIGVLLLVAAVAALAVLLLGRARRATVLASAAADAEQARFDAIGAAAVARLVATDLAAAGPRAGSEWPRRQFDFGSLTVRLRPGGNCLNTNSVVSGGRDGPFRADPGGIAAWDALNSNLKANAPNGSDMASRIAGHGLVTGSHQPLLPPEMSRLLCALPEAAPSAIDIDTVTPAQAPLLALAVPIAGPAVAGLVAARPSAGWGSLSAFWKAAGVSPHPGKITPQLGSRWFRLEVNSGRFGETMLIDAGHTPAIVVERRWRP